MRNSLWLFYFLIAGCLSVMAQTRSDLIYKLDKTSVSAVVDEIGETDISYFLLNDAQKQRTQRIAKKQVWKIVFANGDTEIINELPLQTGAPVAVLVPDRIHLINKTVIEGSVIKIRETTVEYRRAGAPAGAPVSELSRQRIAKIEYSNGEVETFTATPSKSGKSTVADNTNHSKIKEPAGTNRIKSEKIQPRPSIRSRGSEYAKVTFTVGGEGVYLLESMSKGWVEPSEGVGLLYGVGGSGRVDLRLVKPLALSLSGGYQQLAVRRDYTLKGDVIYTENNQLTTVPLMAGLKIYLYKGFYLMGEGGINMLHLTGNSTQPDTPVTDTKANKTAYGGAFGVQSSKPGFAIDVSVYYRLIDASGFNEVNNPIHFVGLRLGIGFGK